MKYLIIDASLNGTGIRDQYEGGYVEPESLGLKSETINLLRNWLLRYENEHYNGYKNEKLNEKLDKEGKEIALIIKNELLKAKIEYFSDAKMIQEVV